MPNLTMSVGRDYRTSSRYEFVIFDGDMVVHREGCFTTSTAAKRAGLKAAERLQAEKPTVCGSGETVRVAPDGTLFVRS